MNKIAVFSRQFGLGTIAQDLGVQFTPHRAVDDAFATMKIAEALCVSEGLTLPKLLEKYEIKTGRIENYEITQSTSSAFQKHLEEVAKNKERRENNRREFRFAVEKEKKKRNKEGKLSGKSVCFSHPFEVEIEQSIPLLKEALAAGLYITGKAEECDYYVAFSTESGPRLLSVKGKVFTPEEFEEFLK